MSVFLEGQEAFRKRLGSKLSGVRFPLIGTFELTWSCNFRCVHCYLRGFRPPGAELDTAALRRILDELAAAGCIGLAFTGGEPLRRPDFEQIHYHAVRAGFLVTVFSNGSLIDDRLADFFADCPPRCVEVSLYGGDEDSYDWVTRSPGSFRHVLLGIDRLVERGLEVMLKAVLLNPILGKVEKIRRLAKARGLRLRFDPSVDPTLTGDPAPISLRPEPELAAEIELGDPQRVQKLSDYDREWKLRPTAQGNSTCGAGFSSFHIDPLGNLMPCLLIRKPVAAVLSRGFKSAWRKLGRHPRAGFAQHSPCGRCELKHLCAYCPGLAEIGDLPPAGGKSFHCRVARSRANAIQAGARPGASP